jgi:CsoR family transcriptional regulator, copper-sensing transcriptional repressor
MGYDRHMTVTDANTTNEQSGSVIDDRTTQTGGQVAPRTSTSYAHDKAKIMARLRRMEGQVRGVQRMVEEDQYCLDVLTQLSAIIAAARQTGLLVLEDHVRGCVLGSEQAHDEIDREELLTELIGAIDRFGRSVG